MISKIEPPRMDAKDTEGPREQIKELRRYLCKLAEDINYALCEIERRLDNEKEK